MAEMHVIALAQQKGGVGKSTLAIHIAAEAQRNGQQAIVVELDRQGTASQWGESSKKAGLGKPDVLRQEANQLEQTLGVMKGLDVKLVVLDLPGSANPAMNAAIKVSDLVLLPCRPQETDIIASAEPLAAVQRLGKAYAYVMTFVEGSGARAEAAAKDLTAEGHPVVPQYIWRRQEYVDAIVEGHTVGEWKKGAKGAEEIKSLWAWIRKELETSNDLQAGRKSVA